MALDACAGYWLSRSTLRRRAATDRLPAITTRRATVLRTWDLTAHPSDLLFRSLPARLARILLELVERHPGKSYRGRRSLAFAIYAYHLSDLAGASLEMTSRVLAEWDRKAWIDRTTCRFVLNDEEAIRAVAAGP
jgi:CRP-like cAMP-binding protein